jgi:hypothetical protein
MRLNNTHRETIARRAERSEAFDNRQKEIDFRGDVLAKEARAKLYKPAVIKAADTVGDKWVSVRTTFKLNVGGAQIILHFTEPTALPYDQYGVVGAVEPGDLADRIMTWAADAETLKADRKRARYAIEAMLNNVSTLETLQSVWPEGQQFYSDLEIRKPDLPAVVGTDINKLLGVA